MNLRTLLLLSLLAMAACKKTDDTPAGASNGGESYLSCTINGKNYMFKGKPMGFDPTGVGFYYGLMGMLGGEVKRQFSISGSDIGKQYAYVRIKIYGDSSYRFPLNQRISFSEVQQKEVFVLLRSPIDFEDDYYYADPTTGWINVSRADSIGSGTFGFTAYGLDHNGNRIPNADSVVVTNGKFDIRY
jgi:hypothetical protein